MLTPRNLRDAYTDHDSHSPADRTLSSLSRISRHTSKRIIYSRLPTSLQLSLRSRQTAGAQALKTSSRSCPTRVRPTLSTLTPTSSDSTSNLKLAMKGMAL